MTTVYRPQHYLGVSFSSYATPLHHSHIISPFSKAHLTPTTLLHASSFCNQIFCLSSLPLHALPIETPPWPHTPYKNKISITSTPLFSYFICLCHYFFSSSSYHSVAFPLQAFPSFAQTNFFMFLLLHDFHNLILLSRLISLHPTTPHLLMIILPPLVRHPFPSLPESICWLGGGREAAMNGSSCK